MLESVENSYFFKSLPDDLAISILNKLRTSARYPSYFIIVLHTYVIVLLLFTDIIFVFALGGRLSNSTSRWILERNLQFLLSLMDGLVFGFVQTLSLSSSFPIFCYHELDMSTKNKVAKG